MVGMFYDTSFNEDIGKVTVNNITYTAWDTLNVTDMSFMFGITPFNNGGSPSIIIGIHLKLLICYVLSVQVSIKILEQR
jgi:hypothetical protein